MRIGHSEAGTQVLIQNSIAEAVIPKLPQLLDAMIASMHAAR